MESSGERTWEKARTRSASEIFKRASEKATAIALEVAALLQRVARTFAACAPATRFAAQPAKPDNPFAGLHFKIAYYSPAIFATSRPFERSLKG